MTQQTGDFDIDTVEDEVVRAGITYWRRLKGSRTFPSRRQIVPRELAGLLRNTVLVEVLNDGEDYEFSIVGEVHSKVIGLNLQGGQMRDVARVWPDYGESLRKVYDRLLKTRRPFVLRAVKDRPGHGMIASESAILPVGKNDRVDHILIFSVYKPAETPFSRAAE